MLICFILLIRQTTVHKYKKKIIVYIRIYLYLHLYHFNGLRYIIYIFLPVGSIFRDEKECTDSII
jgi:hypothetical protein